MSANVPASSTGRTINVPPMIAAAADATTNSTPTARTRCSVQVGHGFDLLPGTVRRGGQAARPTPVDRPPERADREVPNVCLPTAVRRPEANLADAWSRSCTSVDAVTTFADPLARPAAELRWHAAGRRWIAASSAT
jgi:hypothetical protein